MIKIVNNPKIANFMGLKKSPKSIQEFALGVKEHGLLYETGNIKHEHLQYRENWNWLMGVVDKIESIEDGKYRININWDATAIYNHVTLLPYFSTENTNKLESTYETILKFINWYNLKNA